MRLSLLLLVQCLGWVPAGDASAQEPVNVQVGSRPYSLVDAMRPGPLRARLDSPRCRESPFHRSDFSIAHRGAPMRYPEHTRESYRAAARMGAGIVECDVTFTQDLQLVCRHAQDDLHTTTNILLVPALAAKCTHPFTPAVVDAAGQRVRPASAECRSSDITLAEFRTLEGRMDVIDPNARTVEEYLGVGEPEVAAERDRGTLLTHAESIRLFRELGVKMIPELKRPVVPMPFRGFSQQDFARTMVEEYRRAGIAPGDVWLQSFSLDDVLYWKRIAPAFGRQTVYLEDAKTPAQLPSATELRALASQGVGLWAPPVWALVTPLDDRLIPSRTALDAKRAGLGLFAWTLERPLRAPPGTPADTLARLAALSDPGRTMELLDVLARDVGVKGVFSDWPGTVTYYANCSGL